MERLNETVTVSEVNAKCTGSLTEIVFESRNREYGSYRLRKNYLRTLVISAGAAIVLFMLVFLVPFLWYMIRETRLDLEMDYIYEVEYIPFTPPGDIRLVEMAKAHAANPVPKQLVPVVSDTMIPGEEIPSPLENSEREEIRESDTASYGTGGSESGRQANADTGIATTIDVYPHYPGGEEARLYYLRRHVLFPKEAIEKGIQGIVTVLFVIEADGAVTNARILHGIGGGCDEEALRVTLEMPRWNPGRRSGRPVRVMVKMPIIFRLPKQ